MTHSNKKDKKGDAVEEEEKQAAGAEEEEDEELDAKRHEEAKDVRLFMLTDAVCCMHAWMQRDDRQGAADSERGKSG